jgi:hypothetical protein
MSFSVQLLCKAGCPILVLGVWLLCQATFQDCEILSVDNLTLSEGILKT